MGWVYRYTDLEDNIIKYIGIVWSENRTLKQRIYEHSKNDEWCKNKKWKIEYINETINTRTDAEMIESHFISLFGTDKYYNVKKSGWGVCSYIKSDQEWKVYLDGNFFEYEKHIEEQQNEIKKLKNENKNKNFIIEKLNKANDDNNVLLKNEKIKNEKLIKQFEELNKERKTITILYNLCNEKICKTNEKIKNTKNATTIKRYEKYIEGLNYSLIGLSELVNIFTNIENIISFEN